MEPLPESATPGWPFPFTPQDWEQTPPAVQAYLRTVLNFLGMTDVTYVRAEGVAMSAEKRQEAVATANRQIADLQVEYPRAA